MLDKPMLVHMRMYKDILPGLGVSDDDVVTALLEQLQVEGVNSASLSDVTIDRGTGHFLGKMRQWVELRGVYCNEISQSVSVDHLADL